MGVLSDAFRNLRKKIHVTSSNVNYTSNVKDLKKEWIRNKTTSTFIVNGKKLKPGTAEYLKAEMDLEKDMIRLDRDMADLNESMKGFGRNMNDVSQELKNIFK